MAQPSCRDCQFYQMIDNKEGKCFGSMVAANQDRDECPTDSFMPKMFRDEE